VEVNFFYWIMKIRCNKKGCVDRFVLRDVEYWGPIY